MPVTGQHDKAIRRLEKKAMRRSGSVPALFTEWKHTGEVLVDSIHADPVGLLLDVYLSPAATHIPVRTSWVDQIRKGIGERLGRPFREYSIRLYARNRLLEEYIPNLYREYQQYDTTRFARSYQGLPLVTRSDRPVYPGGLTGRHIALWPSHGFFFDQQLDRWQWQRARLWETVEDIFPWSFTADYLIPMLESAGATVLLPRERDIQVNEVIVDNDLETSGSQLLLVNGSATWGKGDHAGFLPADTLFTGQNPFEMGTYLAVSFNPGDSATLVYIPEIPETGEYAVYASWARSDRCIPDVRYEVRYSGGKVEFSLNQCMGAATWVYLGTFLFRQGVNRECGSVVVHGGDSAGILTADAVRFGGGMGNVARNSQLSGKPRWMEGSRYYLQYAGMPDSLVYNLNSGKNDYNDDYMSRGEWVNYLIGPSKPQYSDKYRNGPGIPVDLALAFHTDAGVTDGDSIIGTLGIYSSERQNGLFPDGQSKMASRDLTDLIQTQIVEDIRKLANPEWTRRALWDREYSEAWRPVVPVMLLELLSHQNLADMQYGLDPRFKFITARAIYKGMLRYLSVQDDRKVVIQPLPPDHMCIEDLGGMTIKLSWSPVHDPVEPTALPTGYRVYRKTEEDGFETGLTTQDTLMILTLPDPGKIYSYRVTAFNDGGESLPGETLSVCLLPDGGKPVLVVNAFDRICGPAFFDRGEMAGIAWWEDEGVPRVQDLSNTGNQYDFNRNSDWLHDDSQGWGASNADMETWPVAGNSFAFPQIHGRALRDAGYSFVSVSDEVFISPGYQAGNYAVLDLIMGEERGTVPLQKKSDKEFRVFTPALMESLSRFTKGGGNVLITGSYIGTDMVENGDSLAIRFASAVLHYTWRTNHATTIGSVNITNKGRDLFPEKLAFNTDRRSELYRVESPDAIEPAGEGAFRIYRYDSGNCSAGIAYQGNYRTVALGFPFETIATAELRSDLMKRIMKFFSGSLLSSALQVGAEVR